MAEVEGERVIAMQGRAFYGKHSSKLNDESRDSVIIIKLLKVKVLVSPHRSVFF